MTRSALSVRHCQIFQNAIPAHFFKFAPCYMPFFIAGYPIPYFTTSRNRGFLPFPSRFLSRKRRDPGILSRV